MTGENMTSKIRDLLKYCCTESAKGQFPGIEYQMLVLSVKSLMPFEDKVGCMIDKDRYLAELEVFKYYRNGIDDALDFLMNNRCHSGIFDTLLEFRILPIVMSNTDYKTLEEEALKLVFLYTLNVNSIIDGIVLSSAVCEHLCREEVSAEDIALSAKDRLIQFSLKEFTEKNNIEIDRKMLIAFEKERVKEITGGILSDDKINKYKTLQHIVLGKKSQDEINEDCNNVLESFGEYIQKLRMGIISPEKLKIQKGLIRDFKYYLKSPTFSHPLLGKCRIEKNSGDEIIFRNKLGLFKVKI
jgi:hypothetical protein